MFFSRKRGNLSIAAVSLPKQKFTYPESTAVSENQKPNRKPFFRFVKSIVKIFRRKPEFVYLGNKPQGACIYISNHCAASGPTAYELFLPTDMRMWGTYEMCGNFKSRWRYLNRIYFRQKKKRTKLTAFMLATVICPFMALFYNGMKIIPTYPDFRFTETLRTSVSELENGVSILIYPENSEDGYHEVLTEFFGGFYSLAKTYFDKTGKDIDIVNMYYDKKTAKVIVGEPRSYTSVTERFGGRDEVVKFFLDDTNNMYYEHILPLRPKKKKT